MNRMRRTLKMVLKSAVESALVRSYLRRVDYDLAPYPPNAKQAAESLADHLRAVFAAMNINCLLDVGANNGQYGAFLRDIGYTGRIVSFEPVRRNFDELTLRARGDSKWVCHQLALGEQSGEREMRLTRYSVFDSFLAPNDYSASEFGGESDVIGAEKVMVHRLDGIFDDCVAGMDDARVFLKMDTQGYDLKVIEGATGCMDRMLAVQTELSVKPIYENMPAYLDVVPLLNRLGFDVTGLFPVNRDASLRVIEFDCVAIRSR